MKSTATFLDLVMFEAASGFTGWGNVIGIDIATKSPGR